MTTQTTQTTESNNCFFYRPEEKYGAFSQWADTPFVVNVSELHVQLEKLDEEHDVNYYTDLSYVQEFFKGDPREFHCTEQWMMLMKALLFRDKMRADEIMVETDARKIKRIGRQIKDFDTNVWDKYKFGLVQIGNYFKFSQNDEIKDLLVGTGRKILVEASPYDKIWGIGISAPFASNDPEEWKGQNLLGKVLMEVRKDLK